MKISVIGINHKTASVAIREKLTFSPPQVNDALRRLKEKFPETEFVLLSTCNRTELYYSARRRQSPEHDYLSQFLGELSGLELDKFKNSLYFYHDQDAVRHLLTVAASLDSLVVGEAQIIAQVKESYRLAAECSCTGKVLNRLFHCAFATSKEVYTVTSIAQRRVSIAGVAVELARQLFADITQAKITVIGAGEMGELLIRHLRDIGCNDITIFNRHLQRAQRIASQYDIATGDWQLLRPSLRHTDIVIAAAMAEDYLFDKSYIDKRQGKSLLIIDIAVPRNFDPALNEIEDVYLYSIDDLGRIIHENLQARQDDIGQAREIITDNVDSFMDWFGVMDIGPLIGRLRRKFHQINKNELEHFFANEDNITALQKQKMEAAVNRTVDKLLHRLINNFHTIARKYGPDEATRLIESIIQYEDRTDRSD